VSELFAAGLNHKGAPIELRERLAVGDGEHAELLDALRSRAGLTEVMVVSTCNRVEIYGVAPDRERAHAALGTLAMLREVDPDHLHGHVFTRAAHDAARHIFRVAASLESLVVGEPQILGQVKDALHNARESGTVGPVLDRCLSLAFKCAKRVRSETEIARGSASVPSVAVDLARTIFGELQGSPVLVIGAGEMAEQAATHLAAAGVGSIAVVNRSPERAQALARRIEARAEPWDKLADELRRADIVVASTGSKLPIVDRRMLKPVMKARRWRPLFFVDIAVPRDIDPEVVKLQDVFLYNVDDLQGIVNDNLRNRRDEADRADALVDEEVATFAAWMRARSIGPLIGQLQAHGRTIVEAETQRALQRLGELPPEQLAIVEQLGRAIMQKLLHRPMSTVRKAGGAPIGSFDAETLAEALQVLFELQAGAEPRPAALPAAPDATAPEPAPTPVVAKPFGTP
jgi:glutamyl-tRNA reductase